MTDDLVLLRRLMRTVRVATHTALAGYELETGRRMAGAPVRFLALAAKGPAGWRFPEDGLAAGDGLLTARLERAPDGSPLRLRLQAEGSAGLDVYAGARGVVSFSPVDPVAAVVFDGDGLGLVELQGLGLDEEDLADFEIALGGEA